MKRPVRVMFLEHQFVVGGAERVLANLLESFDRSKAHHASSKPWQPVSGGIYERWQH
ncbi:MAG TPA: hypothetical protein VFI02_17490 [Armatimonadota bacterium]|nr:hypothetical protein [Armatimonadota bacterium]